MDDQKFSDVPSGKSISYEQFIIYLEQGREIEFVYDGKEYFISHSQEGRALWYGKTRLSDYFSQSDIGGINFIKIDGINIMDLFKQRKVEIQTIF